MEFLSFIVMLGVAFSGLVLAVFPQTKWFSSLNTFEENTTIEDILNDHRKDD